MFVFVVFVLLGPRERRTTLATAYFKFAAVVLVAQESRCTSMSSFCVLMCRQRAQNVSVAWLKDGRVYETIESALTARRAIGCTQKLNHKPGFVLRRQQCVGFVDPSSGVVFPVFNCVCYNIAIQSYDEELECSRCVMWRVALVNRNAEPRLLRFKPFISIFVS